VTEVVTGEAVVLDVPCARFPSRIAALFIDLVIQVAVLVAVLVAVSELAGDLDAAWTAGIFLTGYVVIVVGYSASFETLTRGKTPGKMVFGLRVISDDGGPVRFRQALVRALTGTIEIWFLVGAPFGLMTSIVSVKGKRLGDMFAGTYVIQERAPRRPDLLPVFATVAPQLLGWAQVVEASRLSDQTAEAAGSYLRRFHELAPAARHDLGLRIATAVLNQVSPPPPPGTPPWAYLAAVLAIRRQQEQARLARQRLAAADGSPGAPGPWQTAPASSWGAAQAAAPPPSGRWTSPAGLSAGGAGGTAPGPWCGPAAGSAAGTAQGPWEAPAGGSATRPWEAPAGPAENGVPGPAQSAPSAPAPPGGPWAAPAGSPAPTASPLAAAPLTAAPLATAPPEATQPGAADGGRVGSGEADAGGAEAGRAEAGRAGLGFAPPA
jgi:uncharacterized RDD family membrane protein YckC